MKSDLIEEVRIGADGRLHVKPASARFPQMWREAMEVHWDADAGTLHSPVPREWSYARWFQQILAAAKEQGCAAALRGYPVGRCPAGGAERDGARRCVNGAPPLTRR